MIIMYDDIHQRQTEFAENQVHMTKIMMSNVSFR